MGAKSNQLWLLICRFANYAVNACRLYCQFFDDYLDNFFDNFYNRRSINMMALLGTIFIGLIVGFIARALKPGDDKLGWIMTAVLGVAGSFLANYAGQALGWYQPGQAAGFIAAVVGAVILLFVYALIKSKTS